MEVLLPEHQTLKVDKIISGFTSEGESLLLRVSEGFLTTNLDVEEVRLEHSFDLEVSFVVSRPEQIPLSIESRARHRQ